MASAMNIFRSLAGGEKRSQIQQTRPGEMKWSAQPALIRLRTGRVRNVRRHRRPSGLTLHHSFGEPLKPLRPCVALVLLPDINGIRQQFSPRNQDWSAKKIVNDVDGQFAMKE